jgi:hypothetical protein
MECVPSPPFKRIDRIHDIQGIYFIKKGLNKLGEAFRRRLSERGSASDGPLVDILDTQTLFDHLVEEEMCRFFRSAKACEE